MHFHRRHFLKISPGLLFLPFVSCQSGRESKEAATFPIEVRSDREKGHLLFANEKFVQGESFQTECLIIGGGIAGLSAACQLKNKDFLLCELSDRLGGSASSQLHNRIVFCQGAHYDLIYPNYFGKEVLGFLEELHIIRLDPLKQMYLFSDQQYMIDTRLENRCVADGRLREDVLPETPVAEAFLDQMEKFSGKLPLPLRLIGKEFASLNHLNFESYLKENVQLNAELLQAIHYQLTDDFGGNAREVSALAGISYYASRRYRYEDKETFSPPEGNYYFIQKMTSQLPLQQLMTSHLVNKLQKINDGWKAEVIDLEKREIKQIKANKIIYAGQKHALKYIYPQAYPLFQENVYAPWMVINFVFKKDFSKKGFWQNELLSGKNPFLGFIDSKAQVKRENRVLSAYYCFGEGERKQLLEIEQNPFPIVQHTLEEIRWFFAESLADLGPQVEKVYIHLMGHAMPVPRPGYLLNDRNTIRSEKSLVFAGVDNGRLPVLFEALDSGITAVKELNAFKNAVSF